MKAIQPPTPPAGCCRQRLHVTAPNPPSTALLPATAVALVLGVVTAPGTDLMAVIDTAGHDRLVRYQAAVGISARRQQQGGGQDQCQSSLHV